MICKNSQCHNETEEGKKYCKYHLVKKAQKNKTMLAALFTVSAAALFGISRLKKKSR